MIGKLAVSILIVVASVAQAQAQAAPKAAHASTASKAADAPVLPLSAKMRAALVAEMLGVKAGVAELSGAIAMGDWKAVAQQAERIRDSYIMKQKLTSAELEELEQALPADFIEKDGQFHHHADRLAHAARAHDYELEVFYFSKMMDGCGACHARYATHVLKGFEPMTHTHSH